MARNYQLLATPYSTERYAISVISLYGIILCAAPSYSQYVQSVKPMYIEEWDVYHCIYYHVLFTVGRQMGIEISRDLQTNMNLC